MRNSHVFLVAGARILVLAIAVALLAPSEMTQAAPLTVYGGPTYNSSTQTGHIILYSPDPGVNDAGTAVARADNYDGAGDGLGCRADWIDDCLLDLEIRRMIPFKEDEDRDARPVAVDPLTQGKPARVLAL